MYPFELLLLGAAEGGLIHWERFVDIAVPRLVPDALEALALKRECHRSDFARSGCVEADEYEYCDAVRELNAISSKISSYARPTALAFARATHGIVLRVRLACARKSERLRALPYAQAVAGTRSSRALFRRSMLSTDRGSSSVRPWAAAVPTTSCPC